MTWQYLPLIYRVLSPIHIGYRSVGIVDRTRYYVLAKNFWAAATAGMTTKQYDRPKAVDYRTVGNLIQKHLRFTYFYLAIHSPENTSTNLRFFLPEYRNKGTVYLEYPKRESKDFEVNIEPIFIGSYISAGLDYNRNAAMDAMLHEVEYLKPHVIFQGECFDTYLVGGVWVNPETAEKDEGIRIKGSKVLKRDISVLDKLTVGGERGYGFGRLELTENRTDCLGLSRWEVQEGSQNSLFIIPPNQTTSILAHVKYEPRQNYEGLLEPIVGREWNAERGAGRSIANGTVCIAPGGRCVAKAYEIESQGFWRVAKPSELTSET